ncbi:ABC transporter substrate-binding protein [Haliangium sp.]|uniref:ABC transporter substrate-binding protein n=1 Tax=Haliangium sp. TaxID=2663208 RepID=UPI003D0D4C2B
MQNPPTPRHLLALLCCAAVAAGASACKRSSSEAPTEAERGESASAQAQGEPGPGQTAPIALTLQLNWVPEPEFGGFYAAAHRELYDREGLAVDIVAGGAGVPTWNMVATGKVPFAIASAGEIIRARLNGADVVALFAVYQTNPQALMVHEGSGVGTLEEIFTSGKIERVAMEAGLPYGRHLQQRYGFDKVEIVQHGGNLSLFLQDAKLAQQCFIFSEPVSAKEQGVPVQAFSIAESGFDPYLAVVITSGAYLDQHPAVVERFVRATRAGWAAYLDDPAPTNEYMKTQGASMTTSAMALAADLQKPYIVSDETTEHYLGYMSEGRWRTLAEQLRALGEIDETPDIGALFRNLPSEAAGGNDLGR